MNHVSQFLLFMIAGPLVDFKRPVELLQKHDPGQVVGKGHGRHGQLQPCLLLDGGMQAVGASDDESQMLG